MSVVLLFGRKNLSLWSARDQLATGLSTSMRSVLVTPLGSHGFRNSTLCPDSSLIGGHIYPFAAWCP
jgi:hypothetical protein